MTATSTPPGELEPIETASVDELRALQLDRLRWSLRHAYDNVPYYRSMFDVAAAHPDLGPVRSRRGPRRRRPGKLRGDKAYHSAEAIAWLRGRGIASRIARPGIESAGRLGRHRWKIERSIAWLFGYRRLTIRYERKGSHFLAFLGLAAILTCYKKLAKLAHVRHAPSLHLDTSHGAP